MKTPNRNTMLINNAIILFELFLHNEMFGLQVAIYSKYSVLTCSLRRARLLLQSRQDLGENNISSLMAIICHSSLR